MRVSIGIRAGFVFCVLSLAWTAADGQEMAERIHVVPGIGTTVSVATLRIPNKAWRHFTRAKVAAQHNRLDEADRETAKALAIAPDFAAAYLLRANSEVRAHSFDAAIADAKEARRVEPEMMWAGIVLASAYNGFAHYENARQVLLGLRGGEAETWQAAYERARAATGLNDVEGALHWSEVALDSAPENFADVHLVRTNALVLARRWSEAQGQMEIYLQAKVPQERRVEVLAALETVKMRVREEELRKVASR